MRFEVAICDFKNDCRFLTNRARMLITQTTGNAITHTIMAGDVGDELDTITFP